MKQFILFALVSLVVAKADKSCIPRPSPQHPAAPASVTHVTSEASATDPSLKSDIRILEGITESSPTFIPVETIIESYARSHESTISQLEYDDAYPSDVVSVTEFTEIETHFPTLAMAVSQLVSEESTHTSLADIQSSFQAVMVHYPTIVTAAETSFEFSYSSLLTAESGISKAEVISPSIVTDVEVLTTMISISPSLASALTELTDAAEYYTTALHQMTKVNEWTESNEWRVDKTLKSIEACYSSLYSAVIAIDTFLESHSSASEAFSNVVSVLTSVPSIITDVTSFVTAVSSSFTEALVNIRPAIQYDSHITTEVTYLDILQAAHPYLSCAERTLEREIKSHPNTVSVIEVALSSPAAVRNPAYVSSLERRYPSILSALSDIYTLEQTHQSLAYVQQQIDSDERVVPSLLTDVAEVVSETSPSLVGDAEDLAKVEYISPSISVALEAFSSIVKRVPALSCDESVVAEYALKAPSAMYEISEALDHPSAIAASSVAYIAKLTAEYRSLASAMRQIDSDEHNYPELRTVQSEITFALTYVPSLLSVYKQLTEYEKVVSDEVCSFAPSY